jgi:hypothetical protein
MKRRSYIHLVRTKCLCLIEWMDGLMDDCMIGCMDFGKPKQLIFSMLFLTSKN